MSIISIIFIFFFLVSTVIFIFLFVREKSLEEAQINANESERGSTRLSRNIQKVLIWWNKKGSVAKAEFSTFATDPEI